MPVGLELRRAGDNALILSNNIRNPNLIASGNTAAGSVPATGKIRAVRSSVGAARWSTAWRQVGGGNVDYYNFDNVGPTSTNIGLEIYADAVGSPIQFSTHPNNKPLRVIQTFDDIGHPVGGSGGALVQLADYGSLIAQGRTLAFAQGLYAGSEEWENGAINTGTGMSDDLYWAKINYLRVFYIDASGKLFATYDRTDPPTSSFTGTGPSAGPPGSNTYHDKPMLMVIDVTGY